MEFQICHCKILCISQYVFLLQHGEVIAKSWQTPSDTAFCIYPNVWHLAMNRVISLTFRWILGICWFSMFEAPRNDRKFIHAWWGEQGIGDLEGKAMPGWAEKVLEQIRMEQQQLRGQWHFLGCGNAPQNLFWNNARSRSNVFKPFCNLFWNQETFWQQDVEDNDTPAIQACLPGSRTQHN